MDFQYFWVFLCLKYSKKYIEESKTATHFGKKLLTAKRKNNFKELYLKLLKYSKLFFIQVTRIFRLHLSYILALLIENLKKRLYFYQQCTPIDSALTVSASSIKMLRIATCNYSSRKTIAWIFSGYHTTDKIPYSRQF